MTGLSAYQGFVYEHYSYVVHIQGGAKKWDTLYIVLLYKLYKTRLWDCYLSMGNSQSPFANYFKISKQTIRVNRSRDPSDASYPVLTTVLI